MLKATKHESLKLSSMAPVEKTRKKKKKKFHIFFYAIFLATKASNKNNNHLLTKVLIKCMPPLVKSHLIFASE